MLWRSNGLIKKCLKRLKRGLWYNFLTKQPSIWVDSKTNTLLSSIQVHQIKTKTKNQKKKKKTFQQTLTWAQLLDASKGRSEDRYKLDSMRWIMELNIKRAFKRSTIKRSPIVIIAKMMTTMTIVMMKTKTNHTNHKKSYNNERWWTCKSNSDLLSFKRYKIAKKSSVSTSVSRRILWGLPSTDCPSPPKTTPIIKTMTTQRILRNNIFSIWTATQKSPLQAVKNTSLISPKLLHQSHSWKHQEHKSKKAKNINK